LVHRWFERFDEEGVRPALDRSADLLQTWCLERQRDPASRVSRRVAAAAHAAQDAGFGDTPSWVPVGRLAHRFIPCLYVARAGVRVFRTCPLPLSIFF
jgi:hypothetical protein